METSLIISAKDCAFVISNYMQQCMVIGARQFLISVPWKNDLRWGNKSFRWLLTIMTGVADYTEWSRGTWKRPIDINVICLYMCVDLSTLGEFKNPCEYRLKLWRCVVVTAWECRNWDFRSLKRACTWNYLSYNDVLYRTLKLLPINRACPCILVTACGLPSILTVNCWSSHEEKMFPFFFVGLRNLWEWQTIR